MEGVKNIEDFESRLLELEKRVYGEIGRRNKQVKCADSIVKIHGALGNTANKRERVKVLHKKTEDLIKYLEPNFTEHIAVSDTMKLEFILAEEEFLLSQAVLLEQVSGLLPVLDSSYIKAVPEHVAKLQRLSQIQLAQQEKSDLLSADVRKQLEDYNKMMLLLSKQFSQWDETLRQLEEAEQVKPLD